MNANRSTQGNSSLRWLNVMQRGGTEDRKRLCRECRDPAVAQAVAATLAWRDPDLLPSALLWKFLLEDLHPELQLGIELKEERNAVGV